MYLRLFAEIGFLSLKYANTTDHSESLSYDMPFLAHNRFRNFELIKHVLDYFDIAEVT